MIIDSYNIDIVGLENGLKALNDLHEDYPNLLKKGCSTLVDNIRDNLTADIAKLYFLLQHEKIAPSKIEGLINECMRFKNLFVIDRIRGCEASFIAAIIQLNRGISLIFEFTQEQTKNVLNKCMTDRAIKYFERALENGFMTKADNKYKWLWGEPRGKVRLAYFLHEIYNPKGIESIPYKSLEVLSKTKRLDVAVEQAINPKKPQRWREAIDNLVFYD